MCIIILIILQDLFATYGASVDQLKNICSSLEDCEGFNSEGWVKSRVEKKHPVSSIDLYVKHKVALGQVRMKTDLDAGVFRTLLEDYDLMNKNLKMYLDVNVLQCMYVCHYFLPTNLLGHNYIVPFRLICLYFVCFPCQSMATVNYNIGTLCVLHNILIEGKTTKQIDKLPSWLPPFVAILHVTCYVPPILYHGRAQHSLVSNVYTHYQI